MKSSAGWTRPTELKKGCLCTDVPAHLQHIIRWMSDQKNSLKKHDWLTTNTGPTQRNDHTHPHTYIHTNIHTTMPRKKTTPWPQHVALTATLLNHYRLQQLELSEVRNSITTGLHSATTHLNMADSDSSGVLSFNQCKTMKSYTLADSSWGQCTSEVHQSFSES